MNPCRLECEASPVVTLFGAADNTAGPFGFTYDANGNLLLNHVNSFTFASYQIEQSGVLTPISGPVPISGLGDDSPLQFGAFNCWVARGGSVAYVMTSGEIPATNGGSPDGPGIISALNIAEDGDLRLLPTNALGSEGIVAIFPQDDREAPDSTLFGNHGIDLTTVDGSQGSFLYAVQPRLGRIGQWQIDADGTLTDLGAIGGLDEGVDPFAGTNPGINDFLERCFNQSPENRNPECALGSAQGLVGY